MKIQSALRITGKLSLSGDKSISHRAALIAALAEGRSVLSNFSTSADCNSTLNCLRGLGVAVHRTGNEVVIEGTGPSGLKAPEAPLDCGNSGSTMRMLAGVLAGCDFASILTGDESLRSRPMKRIIEPLQLMNAEVDSVSGRPPLQIRGSRSVRAISYLLPVASAQVKSCVLLAGLQANGETEVIERLGSTRDHTERMLQWFGAAVQTRSNESDGHLGTTVALNGPARLSARDIRIPGDLSSAAFLIAAAALLPGSDLAIEGVGLNPTRTAFLSILQANGLSVLEDEVRNECNEPVGTVRVRGGSAGEPVRAFHPGAVNVVWGGLIPKLIDELPLLAVVGSQINGGLTISDAAELRVKEADRIRATVCNLRAMGATVDEFEDGLRVFGPTKLNGAEIDSFGDHRIAMAFSVAALLADGPSEIAGADCVAISFPEFFELLESVTERVA